MAIASFSMRNTSASPGESTAVRKSPALSCSRRPSLPVCVCVCVCVLGVVRARGTDPDLLALFQCVRVCSRTSVRMHTYTVFALAAGRPLAVGRSARQLIQELRGAKRPDLICHFPRHAGAGSAAAVHSRFRLRGFRQRRATA